MPGEHKRVIIRTGELVQVRDHVSGDELWVSDHAVPGKRLRRPEDLTAATYLGECAPDADRPSYSAKSGLMTAAAPESEPVAEYELQSGSAEVSAAPSLGARPRGNRGLAESGCACA